MRMNVPSGMKPTEKKALQKQKPSMSDYSGISKKLNARTLNELIEPKIRDRDNLSLSKEIALIHI